MLKRVSHEVGWSHRDVVDRLEAKRIVKSAAAYERRVRLRAACDRADATQTASRKSRSDAAKANSSAQEISTKLAAFGHA